MEFKIYIQALNNFPIADWAVSAYMGFREKQANIIFFEDIEEVPVSRNNIVVGFIEDTNKYFAKLGLPPKMCLNIPEELMEYAGREIHYVSMKEFREFASDKENLPIFVKPNGLAKAFIAGVVTKPETISCFDDVADDCPILLSEVVDFVSEYRGYVIDGKLVGIKHYRGDFRVFPDMKVIDRAIADYKNQPAGYSIDFGIIQHKKWDIVYEDTLLIECNDGWSLGNYGLEDVTYSTLLAKRWLELMKELKKA